MTNNPESPPHVDAGDKQQFPLPQEVPDAFPDLSASTHNIGQTLEDYANAPVGETSPSRSIKERLDDGDRIPLSVLVRENFLGLPLSPRHRDYVDSLSSINVAMRKVEKVERKRILDDMEPASLVANEYNDTEVVTSRIVGNPDGTRSVEVTFLEREYYIEGKGSEKIGLLDIAEEDDDKISPGANLFSHKKERSHIGRDVIDGLLAGARDYIQLKRGGISAKDWAQKLKDENANCIDYSIFKLLYLQLHPAYFDFFNKLSVIGYSGNSIMSGGDGDAQHYGLVYLDSNGRIAFMPGGGSFVNAASLLEEERSLGLSVGNLNGELNSDLDREENYNPGNPQRISEHREMKAEVLRMARIAREIFPEETKDFLASVRPLPKKPLV